MTNDITIHCSSSTNDRLAVLARLNHCSREAIIQRLLSQSLDLLWDQEGALLERIDRQHRFPRAARFYGSA